ncbi:MAG: TlyA family RNA methyltransferase [Selenomonadales bacterium]|jgi:23S rRNA (cytidine1920-2'-O)/16S rRNA (cytidine1409-2'-O)-methyltransferase|nr:TlyA family RNA methyltransferase [Selenomonadales bacterium]
MPSVKRRLDVLLCEKGLASTRMQAQALIQSGAVRVGGQLADKPGHAYPPESVITVLAAPHAFASRGGLKLEQALKQFDIKLAGRVVLDVGAASGGFTDCALQNGATYVIAVDVGQGQLAWKLRNDSRVQVLEKTNIRYLRREQLREQPDAATVDVSFISLSLVLPALNHLLPAGADVIALIKPQFEAGKQAVARGRGVIRDAAVHMAVVAAVLQAAKSLGWGLFGLTYSPIKGPEGNIEFLGWWKTAAADGREVSVEQVVADAHREAK